jgi:demethylmenaquinone methyltransferase/2-methoxy-6-polyprenyl-1,4-benzoquinol methylase
MKRSENGQPGVLPVFNTRTQTRAFYDKISRVYDLLADRSEAPVRNRGLKTLAAEPGETVLEIGCGTGGSLASIAEAVGPEGRVFGVDLSTGMLEQSGRLLGREKLGDRAELLCADAVDLPFVDDRLDAVFMSFTLELFDTPEIPAVLAECRRVLRPGGRLVVVGMSKEGDPDAMVRVYEWAHRHFPNFVDCRPIFVRRAIEEAGLQVSRAEITHMWVPVEIILAENPRRGFG